MSPKKITDADKLEIVDLYRQSGDTTASLASRYGVSNSTISRLLKTSIPEDEYDLLIQQKRGAKVSSDDDSSEVIADTLIGEPSARSDGKLDKIDLKHPVDAPIVTAPAASIVDRSDNFNVVVEPLATPHNQPPQHEMAASEPITPVAEIDRERKDRSRSRSTVPAPDKIGKQTPLGSITEDSSANKRLVRRRSSARPEDAAPAATAIDLTSTSAVDRPEAASSARFSTTETLPTTNSPDLTLEQEFPSSTRVSPLPVVRAIIVNREEYAVNSATPNPIAEEDRQLFEDDAEEEPEDVNALAAMFGEEIAEGDDDDEDEEWDDVSVDLDRSSDRDLLLTGDRSQLQVTPLSQATLPRTCYIVIDKFAELIVRPLKDFAELGQIPGEEIQQRTLPIFDNHRIAKRFSNQRTQRVIKVPDSRVFQKTIAHMRSKGIARLLVDGNIYSLN